MSLSEIYVFVLVLFFFRRQPTALTHFNFDATMLSLGDVYKGLCRDRETYYFLWVAVRKVLEEAPNVTK